MVVFDSARNPWQWTHNPFSSIDIGQAGIDLLFVISGFLMIHAEGNARPEEFLIRRIIRVVPLYWMATALAFVRDAAAGHAHGPAELLMSLLFLPFRNAGEDMSFFPILSSGWTLNYAVAFYLLFALLLALRGIGAWLLPMAMLLFGLTALAFNFAGETMRAFYFDPIVLDFAAGALLAWLYRRMGERRSLALAAALPLGIALLLLVPADQPRLLHFGLPAATIMLGALCLERHGGQLRIKPLTLLGDASYAIFLVHVLLIGLFAPMAASVFGYGLIGFSTFIAANVGISIFVGCFVHLYIETPIIWWLSGGGVVPHPVADQRSRKKI